MPRSLPTDQHRPFPSRFFSAIFPLLELGQWQTNLAHGVAGMTLDNRTNGQAIGLGM